VLELCSGAGHIGLAAVAGNDRRLVCVDADPVAATYARQNAEAAGMGDRVEQRLGRLDAALAPAERFPLVIADPPWVRSSQVTRHPEDPPFAIDGGDDGLDVARRCWQVIDRHLEVQGQALLQLGDVGQVEALAQTGGGRLRCVETRQYAGGVVARLAKTAQRCRGAGPPRVSVPGRPQRPAPQPPPHRLRWPGRSAGGRVPTPPPRACSARA
jgi:release factor glutamine methyltransferase